LRENLVVAHLAYFSHLFGFIIASAISHQDAGHKRLALYVTQCGSSNEQFLMEQKLFPKHENLFLTPHNVERFSLQGIK